MLDGEPLVRVPNDISISFILAHILHGSIYYHCIKSIVFTNTYDNIESSLAFYGVYHRTPYNQLIHFFGVPFILWTLLIFAAYIPFTNHPLFIISNNQYINMFNRFVQTTCQLPKQHRVTWATLWVLMYVMFYLSMDVIGACLYIPFLYIMYATSVRWTEQDQFEHIRYIDIKHEKENSRNSYYRWYGTGRLLWNALLVHATSWYIQIHPGHQILEGATPASLVNLGAALTAAPLFAFYEGIWYIGFRQEFQQRVLMQVAVYTQQLCDAGANLRVCSHV